MTFADWKAEQPDILVWPEHLEAFHLLQYMSTQWVYAGIGSRAGLNYQVLHHKMGRMQLAPERFEALEDEVRTVEIEILNVEHERAQRDMDKNK